jgi:uncharacterized Zn-binding protein involved in type VI secretion
MSPAAAKEGDQILATDTHVVVQGTSSTPMAHPFSGIIDGELSSDVKIEGRAAATVDSTATNTPPHIPAAGVFAKQPSDQGTIVTGSATVKINGKRAARSGDTALTCNDPTDLPVGTVQAVSTVSIGG